MKKKKKIMHSLKLDHISAVTRPAQEGATVLLLKRAEDGTLKEEPPKSVDKFAAVTDVVEGHSHFLNSYSSIGGTTDYALGKDDEYSHDHPWLLQEDGSVFIGEANGHTHQLVALSKNGDSELGPEIEIINKEEPMTDEEKAQLDALTKSAARSEAIALLPDIQKVHYQTLEGEEASAFLALDHNDRELAMKSLQGDDPVEYVSQTDGYEYRKSDDPRMIALAKRQDVSEAKAEKSATAALNAQLRKQAQDDLNHYPGDELTKTELLRAVAGIGNEGVISDVFDMLKANNTAMGKAFETLGTEGVDLDDPENMSKASPEAQINALAKKYSEEHNVDEVEAYNKILETPKGIELYSLDVMHKQAGPQNQE